MQGVRTEHQIDIWIAFFDFIRYGLLLHHTAAQPDQHTCAPLLSRLESADVAKYAVLCIFAHSASIVDDQIRLFRRVGEAVSHLRKHTGYLLSVALVLLTSKRMDVGHRRMVVTRGQQFADLPAILHLPQECRRQILLWQNASSPLYML